ncbi:Uma2 family endonuclease [Streptacidiphilus sp. MAP12-20]|uniref:Uma2 family endonuclease n=1 Tax=Streptacidiphilus sp. MAP12-20 TaxID=3156299 RepID=UPI003516EE92
MYGRESAAAEPRLPAGAFEEIARIAAREEVALEFIDGKMWEKPVPDGDHAMIIQWLTRICIQARPELWLFPEQGLLVQGYRNGHARPDGVLAPSEALAGQSEWASADGVLLVAEVTSYDRDTDRRDRVEKPRAYAETGIPVYLLIDRDTCEVVVFADPDGTRYETVRRLPFGRPVELPAPVGILLDTEPLKDWVK